MVVVWIVLGAPVQGSASDGAELARILRALDRAESEAERSISLKYVRGNPVDVLCEASFQDVDWH